MGPVRPTIPNWNVTTLNQQVLGNGFMREKLHGNGKDFTVLLLKKGNIELDVSMGSGSTGVARKNRNRNFII